MGLIEGLLENSDMEFEVQRLERSLPHYEGKVPTEVMRLTIALMRLVAAFARFSGLDLQTSIGAAIGRMIMELPDGQSEQLLSSIPEPTLVMIRERCRVDMLAVTGLGSPHVSNSAELVKLLMGMAIEAARATKTQNTVYDERLAAPTAEA